MKGAPRIAPVPIWSPVACPDRIATSGSRVSGRAVPTAASTDPTAPSDRPNPSPIHSTPFVNNSAPTRITNSETISTGQSTCAHSPRGPPPGWGGRRSRSGARWVTPERPLSGSGPEASFPRTLGSSRVACTRGGRRRVRVDQSLRRARTLPGEAGGAGLELALMAVLVGLAYYIAARFSLRLALVRGQVTPIWPPTGIAVAAMLVFGRRIWPGIALAAFAVNAPLGPSILGAATIAAGNTLAPVLAVTLLDQVGFQQELRRLRDVMVFVGLAALGAMLVSATVGAATLTASGS